LLLLWLVPSLGRIQHLFVSPVVVVSGVELRVPLRYWQTQDSKGHATLWQFISLYAALKHRDLEMITVSGDLPLPNLDLQRDLTRVRNAMVTEGHYEGMSFLAEHQLTAAAGPVDCMEFGSGSRVTGACFLFGTPPMDLRFTGDREHVGDLYSVAASARRR